MTDARFAVCRRDEFLEDAAIAGHLRRSAARAQDMQLPFERLQTGQARVNFGEMGVNQPIDLVAAGVGRGEKSEQAPGFG